MRARGRCDFRRLDLGPHAAARQFGFRRARHRFDLRGDALNEGNEFRIWVDARRSVVEPVDIRQQDQKICAGHGGDAGRETVVIAVPDFVGGNRVVLVDHRHRAPFQQLGDGRARIEIAPSLFGVLQGDQDLAGADAVMAQHLRPDSRQRDLPHCRGGLAFLELERSARQFETAASERDRTGGHDQEFATLAVQPGEVVGQRREPRGAHFAGVGIDQQG